MIRRIIFICAVAIVCCNDCAAQSVQVPPLSNSILRLFNKVESDILTSAEAMPEEKFDFTPDSLHIQGAQFDSVRTFAGQIMHLATDNILIWSAINNQVIEFDIRDVNGPKDIRSKNAVIAYLKHSFDVGRKAIATITAKNAGEFVDFRYRKLSKLDLAFYGIVHSNEHYGQMVVYLRMCGIIPPPTAAGY